jgi:branched-subunit amino acid transport protein
MTLDLWFAAAGLVLATLLARSTLLVFGRHLTWPAWVDDALRYAPACALAAIIGPEVLLLDDGRLIDWRGGSALWAAVAAAALTLSTRNMLISIAGGTSVYWVLRGFGLPV